jgi:hypothetical protein
MVRQVLESTTIKVSKGIHKRLIEDKKHFEKTIGQGKQKWFLNDVIEEYIKILDTVKKK